LWFDLVKDPHFTGLPVGDTQICRDILLRALADVVIGSFLPNVHNPTARLHILVKVVRDGDSNARVPPHVEADMPAL
jgi:hypothetical protein